MPLRNPNINYSKGWFFVTSQVAMNKSIFGLIADGKCVLNDLGKRVEVAWHHLVKIYPDVYFDKFVLMPNHFHAIIKIAPGTEAWGHDSKGAEARGHDSKGTEAWGHDSKGAEAGGHDNNLVGRGLCAPAIVGMGLCTPAIVGMGLCAHTLPKIIHSFKSYTANKIYRPMVRDGLCPDIGASLWQASYYDNLITDKQQLDNIRRYIEQNPARWDRDRFGPVTTYHLGDLELLRERMVAYVASMGTEAHTYDNGVGAEAHTYDNKVGVEAHTYDNGMVPAGAEVGGYDTRVGAETHPYDKTAIVGRGLRAPVISTFTSPQERSVLRACLAARRPIVWVRPGGLPTTIYDDLQAAIDEGRALLLSPVPEGTGVNKQRAIWCNRYVIDQVTEISYGTISRGGMLETLLKAKGIL